MSRSRPAFFAALFLLAPMMRAASIRGVVVEAATGSPLSHVRIEVTPVDGTQGKAVTVRVDRGGSFAIIDLYPGIYTATASREGFFTAEYGQKRWNAAGTPITIDDQHPGFLDFRLQRFGAILGAVVDEQDVGILGQEVVAYRADDLQHPVSAAPTDDYGRYRLAGLEPGAYLVRTKPRQIEDVSYIPTFSREALLAAQADRYVVDLDRATEAAPLRPQQGRLFQVSGTIVATAPGPYKVTFVSDMGRETQESGGEFRFPPVPKGHYELYATGPGDGRNYTEGAYLPLEIQDDKPITLKMLPMRDTQVSVVDGGGALFRMAAAQPAAPANPGQSASARAGRGSGQTSGQTAGVTVLTRRIDLAGIGPPESHKIRGRTGVPLAPGRWELRCVPPDGFYVADYRGTRQKFGERERADAWHEITVEGYSSATFYLKPNAASVRGIVRSYGDPVPAAPIFLEPYDNARHERLYEISTVRADANGHYSFSNLAPGAYRILSTFDFRAPSTDDFEAAGARIVMVDEGRETLLDLDLWGIR